MLPSQLEFLRHILDECTYLLKVTAGKSSDETFADETLCRAIVRSLEIMGEATKRLDADFKLQHPHVEWKKIAATRDVMIHDYFGIDYDIVWSIIKEKLPDLEHYLLEIINAKTD
jgi:uncharacterized protein with HEPN domain